jgi:hypothetical protein
MKRLTALALVLFFATAVTPSAQAGNCWECRYSTNNFGNCRLTDDGYANCTRVVVDGFNGRTDCSMSGYCSSNAGGGGSCWWTDLYGNCIYSY